MIFWGVRGVGNPLLIRKIYTPPSGKETTPPSRIFDLVHLWEGGQAIAVNCVQGEGGGRAGVFERIFSPMD